MKRIALVVAMMASMTVASLIGVSLRPVLAQDIGTVAKSWQVKQVSVGTSATLVADILPTRRKALITTTGTNQVTCGPNNGVTALNGQPIAPIAYSVIVVESNAQVWCIAAAAQVISVMENY